MNKCILMCLIFIFVISFTFPMGIKSDKIPMKPNLKLSILDGELLHYASFVSGEKEADYYFVTKKIDNNQFKIYMDFISKSGVKKLPLNFTNFSTFFIVVLSKGSLMESVGNLDTNDLKKYANFGLGGEIYWHYLEHPEAGYIDYETKKWDGYAVRTRKDRIKIKPDFSYWDMFSSAYFTLRFMDIYKKYNGPKNKD